VGSTALLFVKRLCWIASPCGLVMCCRRFEETYRLYPRDYKSTHGLTTLKTKAKFSVETSEKKKLQYKHGAQTQNTCLLNTKTDLQVIKRLRAVVLPWVKRQPGRYTPRILYCSTFVSFSLVTSDKNVICYYRRFTYIDMVKVKFSRYRPQQASGDPKG
jgi:hypothetical protein